MKSRGHSFNKLTGCVRPCFRVIQMLVIAGGICLARAADDPSSATTNEAGQKSAMETKGTKSDGGANAGLKAFGQMIPLGSRSRGVRIPAFEKGKPSSLIVADAMTRLDDSRIFAEKMVIQVFAEKEGEDMRIDMKTGTYEMEHQMLSSTERSRVSRHDFQIEGDSLVYDTKSAQGKMEGNVEMIIFDASAASKKMDGQTAASGEKTPDGQQPTAPKKKK